MVEGEKTVLRQINDSDIEVICKWEAQQHISADIFGQINRHLAIKEEYIALINARNTKMFAMLTDDGTLIGDIGFVEINWRRGEAELVIGIGHRGYIGKGYGTDAILTLLKYIFSTTSLNHIYLRVLADNLPAIKCFKKCGFRKSSVITRQLEKGQPERKIFLMTIEKQDNGEESH